MMAQKYYGKTMKCLLTSRKIRSLWFVLFVLAFQAFMCRGGAETISNKNSIITLDLNTGGGMTSWTVDGQNQAARQWFWFRVGSSGGESTIDTISGPSVTQASAKLLTVAYANSAYGVSVSYNLSGNNNGSGNSSLNESLTINNYSATTLDFHFFKYTDFNLGGSGNSDTVALFTDVGSSRANQTNGVSFANDTITSAFGANHQQADTGNNILNSLNDGNPTTLNNNPAAGPANVNWAFEYDLVLAPGGGVNLGEVATLQVPEPSTIALVALAAVALSARRWRKA